MILGTICQSMLHSSSQKDMWNSKSCCEALCSWWRIEINSLTFHKLQKIRHKQFPMEKFLLWNACVWRREMEAGKNCHRRPRMPNMFRMCDGLMEKIFWHRNVSIVDGGHKNVCACQYQMRRRWSDNAENIAKHIKYSKSWTFNQNANDRETTSAPCLTVIDA